MVPDKFLVAVTMRQTHDSKTEQIGYVVWNGIHSPFKRSRNFWKTNPSPYKKRSWPRYESYVFPFRPRKADSEYFNFLPGSKIGGQYE